MTDFTELQLDDELVHAVLEAGYKQPTTIQKMVIPHAMDQKDILASAPTGTGKTAAFLLPALQHLLDYPRARNNLGCRVLILAPTRELADQIYQNALIYNKFANFTCGLITGGVNYGSHTEFLEQSVDLIVATPGRLLEYIENERFDCRDIEWLVLDEADRMLDMGFKPAMERIAAETRWRKQTLLFSATLEGAGIASFSKGVLNDPVEVQANPPRKESNKIHQWIHLADSRQHKTDILVHYLKKEGIAKAVVFVKTRDQVGELSGKLSQIGIACCWLQGEMPQDKRLASIDRFINNKVRVLIATDVAARGIDVDDITHVFNFDMPRTADVYIHRIGRTGRAGKKGTAISFVEAHDVSITKKVERYSNQQLKRRTIAGLEPKNREAKMPIKKKKTKVKSTATKNKLAKGKAKKAAKKALKKS